MSKKLMIVWGVVVALLLVLVLIIGIKDKDYNYARLESSIKKATRSYILNNKIFNKLVVHLESFLNFH